MKKDKPSDQWTLAKYSKMCRDANADISLDYSDMVDSPELWYDLAKCLLENEEGLESFIKTKIKARDVIGRLTDDLAYPGNCNSHRKAGVK